MIPPYVIEQVGGDIPATPIRESSLMTKGWSDVNEPSSVTFVLLHECEELIVPWASRFFGRPLSIDVISCLRDELAGHLPLDRT